MLDEKREIKLEDKLFGEMMDEILEDWYLDSDEMMDELFFVQGTIKTLKKYGASDDEIRECCDYGDFFDWRPFDNRLPPMVWDPVRIPPPYPRKAIMSISMQNSRPMMPNMYNL